MATFSANFAELMETRDKRIVFKNFAMQELQYPKVFTVRPSTKSHEDRMRVQGLGGFQLKAEGTPIAFSDPIEGTRRRITHQTFALGYRVTWEATDDDQWNILNRMPADLGDSARDHQERLAFDLINDGFSGSTHTTVDNAALFIATHTNVSGSITTGSNILSPPVGLSVTGLEDLMTLGRTTLTEESRFTDISQSTLLYHPDNAHQAYTLLQTEMRPGTADNDKSTVATSRTGIVPTVDRGVPYLSSSLAWYLLGPKGRNELYWNNRAALFFEQGRDAQTLDLLHMAVYRASVQVDDWRGSFGSNFS